MEVGRRAFKVLTGKPIGRPRRRLKGNVRMDLTEIGNNTRNRIDSVLHRDYWRVPVNIALNLQIP